MDGKGDRQSTERTMKGRAHVDHLQKYVSEPMSVTLNRKIFHIGLTAEILGCVQFFIF